MGENETPNEQPTATTENDEGTAETTPTLESIASELGYDDTEQFVKKVKGLDKWERKLQKESQTRPRRQEVVEPQPVSESVVSGQDDLEQEIASLDPKVRKVLDHLISQTVDKLVGPKIKNMTRQRDSELQSTIQDFLDNHPELTMDEVFETMSLEGLWPDENEATPKLLKRRLTRAVQLMDLDVNSSEAAREKIRAEERKKLLKEQADGTQVKGVTKISKAPVAPKQSTEPKNWVERAQKALEEGRPE